MDAIVLAGGKGARLMPLTCDVPKPVLPVAGYPVLDYVTAHLEYYGVRNIIYAAGYLSECVEKTVKRYGNGNYVVATEKKALGTCGAVKNSLSRVNGDFIVASGDCLSDIDLYKMAAFHFRSGALATMAVKPCPQANLYGVVTADGKGRITAFEEKPENAKAGSLVNLGVYVLSEKAFDFVPDGAFFDFSRDLFPVLMKKGALYAFRHEGFWSDLGDVKSYFEANERFKDGYFYPLPCGGDMCRSGSSLVSFDSEMSGRAENSVICGKSKIARGAFLRECVVLGGEVFGVHYRRIIKDGVIVDV